MIPSYFRTVINMKKYQGEINMPQYLHSIPLKNIRITDRFWQPRMEKHRAALLDCLTHCEATGQINNIRIAAGMADGEYSGHYANDSNIYKILEGFAYYLQNTADSELEKRADEIISMIAAMQHPDGYVNSHYTVAKPGMRWTDMEKHEMYCCGHMTEAGIAYKEATGKETLFSVAKRFCDHIYDRFYVTKTPWVTGHPEIEYALLKLYRYTGETKYRELSQFLIDCRGHGHGIGAYWNGEFGDPSHTLDIIPVEDLRNASGHAVIAMYLYTALTDMMILSPDGKYAETLDSLWESVTLRNMYVTGGIGSRGENEGFGTDYDLPNDTAYCETCAAFALAVWSRQMNLYKANAQYIDVMERALYNGLLAGISLSGNKYFYVNPLSSKGDHHREPWFWCACCPTQVARFMPSIGGYMYARDDAGGLYANLFIGSTVEINDSENNRSAVVRQETLYPMDGNVTFFVDKWERFDTLYIRLPEWCKSFSLTVNGSALPAVVSNGYLTVTDLSAGDKIIFNMDMPTRFVRADPRVEACREKLCMMCGPLVYCAEEADNHGLTQQTIKISENDIVQAETLGAGNILPEGTVILHVFDLEGEKRLTAIPYHLWDNRAPGFMDVWLPT